MFGVEDELQRQIDELKAESAKMKLRLYLADSSTKLPSEKEIRDEIFSIVKRYHSSTSGNEAFHCASEIINTYFLIKK